ncbi:MAG: ABC transporter permease subunit [Culicoidibacterales bacterium]
MRLFLHELRMSWKVALWVNLGTALLVYVGIIKYTGLASDPAASTDLIAQFPKVVLAVVGMGELDISTLGGFYGVLLFYVILIGAAYATSLGINCIAREENEQTIEFLLVKPIARWQILGTKFIAAIFWLTVFLGASAIATLLGLQMIEGGQEISQQVWLATASLFPRFGLYLGVGLLAATFFNKATTGGLLGYTFYALTWILSTFYLMFTELEWFQYLTPFQFYPTQQLLDLDWSWPMTLYSVGLMIVVTAVGFWRYQTTDVRVR